MSINLFDLTGKTFKPSLHIRKGSDGLCLSPSYVNAHKPKAKAVAKVSKMFQSHETG